MQADSGASPLVPPDLMAEVERALQEWSEADSAEALDVMARIAEVAPEWLRRLCARVRELENDRDEWMRRADALNYSRSAEPGEMLDI